THFKFSFFPLTLQITELTFISLTMAPFTDISSFTTDTESPESSDSDEPRRPASKPPSKPASKPASKLASKPAPNCRRLSSDLPELPDTPSLPKSTRKASASKLTSPRSCLTLTIFTQRV